MRLLELLDCPWSMLFPEPKGQAATVFEAEPPVRHMYKRENAHRM
jgi:hypothetical protein